ncbi:hypothetical protein WG907_10555 [Sphingobium sp. AN558]|uniref:hypothetical protein n=1 Tax=Sphingobium sp. AN558 TaxID=3133442 RepID=UPI0030C404AE
MVQVFPSRHASRRADALLNPSIGIEADERLVLGRDEIQIPFRYRNISSIQKLVKYLSDPRDGQIAAALLRVFRPAGEITHEFGLRLEATACEAFKPFLYERRQWLVAHHHVIAIDLLEFITEGRTKKPIAVRRSGLHPVSGLFGILLALVLIGTGEDIFLKASVRIVTELVTR